MQTINRSIKKQVITEASQEVAFNIFTAKMDSWWPKTYHTGSTPMTELVLEPAIGGRWYSKHEDGSEVEVGKVIQCDPFQTVILNWQIDGEFKFDPDLTTEVEVQFIPIDANNTTVILEHRNLDRLGGEMAIESMHQGWSMIMELYKQTVTNTDNI
jgi:hypothetical protein